jgi:mediator of RNA polymerase II transcription subunit 13, fungi type
MHYQLLPHTLPVSVFSMQSMNSAAQKLQAVLGGSTSGYSYMDNSHFLAVSETYQFTPDGIYPCSPSCAAQIIPCSICFQQNDTMATPLSQATSSLQTSSACILPRKPLRLPLARFIQAVRDRVVDDITQLPVDPSMPPPVRLQEGFLLRPSSVIESGEWGNGWEHIPQSRPYVHCELQIHLSRLQLLVHPVLRNTQYFPLDVSLPLPVGTPIVLLPHGVPAYYLNTYSGALGGLTAQFDEALIGLGGGNWKGHSNQKTSTSRTPGPSYLIAWVSVQNKQGEEKGLPIIWPVSLSVLPDRGSPQARQPLAHVPDLPAQLLASPPAAPINAPPIDFPLSFLNPSSSVLKFDHETSPSFSGIPTKNPHAKLMRPFTDNRPTSDSLRAFRSLSIVRRDVPNVACDISAYVDSVARDREKERERLKREREGSSSKIVLSLTKAEAESTHSSPATHATAEQDPTPELFKQATPSAGSDKPLPVQDPTEATSLSWSSGQALGNTDIGGLLPPADIAQPSNLATTAIPADVAVILPETGGLAGGDKNMMVDPSNSFDTFTAFESTWNPPANDFMNMDMPLDSYSFGMNMSSGNGNEGTNLGVDDGFGIFTDDDFSFFDAPSNPVRAAAPGLPSLANPAATSSTPLGGLQTSGSELPPYASHDQPTTWSGNLGIEGLTPRSIPASTPGLFPPPELIPSTPIQTPPSHSGPSTPAILLADHPIHVRRYSGSSQGSSFDPIPFAATHKASDDKYVMGKFALPTSPPDEVERIWPIGRHHRDSSSSPMDWKYSYGFATDPRIGMVRRLVGAKRKRLSSERSPRSNRGSPAWMCEHEEWASCSSSTPEEPEPESRSDSDIDLDEDGPEAEDRSTLSESRPYTPPLSYLPLGPSLLRTNFHHRFLLPLSVALRPPSVAATQGNIGVATGPMSVPTPVSPDATLHAASERSRTLETAAHFLVKEIVENPAWADAWLAHSAAKRGTPSYVTRIWQADVRQTHRMLSAVSGIRPSVKLEEIFDSGGHVL